MKKGSTVVANNTVNMVGAVCAAPEGVEPSPCAPATPVGSCHFSHPALKLP